MAALLTSEQLKLVLMGGIVIISVKSTKREILVYIDTNGSLVLKHKPVIPVSDLAGLAAYDQMKNP